MTGLFIILFIVILIKLVGVASITIMPPQFGAFELERRAKLGDKEAVTGLGKQAVYSDLISLQRLVISLALVFSVLMSIVLFGWFFGVVISILIALQYGTFARLALIHAPAQKLYERYEPSIIALIQKYPQIVRVLRTITVPPKQDRIDSREELLHYVAESGLVLAEDEKQLIMHGLAFKEQTVESVMTPRSVIDVIKKGELLGPLVLDDLHKTGHSRFPVVDRDIDHVVGMLHIRDLLVLDTTKKHTAKVETVMDPSVFYIRHDQTLDHALAAFIRLHHHLFIVVNEYRETVGLLSLEDVIEALLGKKIIDEFDAHDDLRTVAERNPRANNMSSHGKDI